MSKFNKSIEVSGVTPDNLINRVNKRLIRRADAFGTDITATDILDQLDTVGVIITTDKYGHRVISRSKKNHDPGIISVIQNLAQSKKFETVGEMKARVIKSIIAKTMFERTAPITVNEFKSAYNLVYSGSCAPLLASNNVSNSASNNASNNASGKVSKRRGKKYVNPTANPFAIVTFDIETNQYYNYEAWEKYSVCTKVKPVNDIVNKYIQAELPGLRKVNYIAGFNVCRRVRDKSLEEVLKVYEPKLNAIKGKNSTATWVARRQVIDSIKMMIDESIYCSNNITNKTIQPWVKPAYSEMYLGNFLKIPYLINGVNFDELREDTIKNFITTTDNITWVYDVNSVSEYLAGLEAEARQKNAPAVVAIHNLGYEMNNCILQTEWFKKAVEAGRVDILTNNAKGTFKSINVYESFYDGSKECRKTNKVLIYFRDTWKLTAMSIAEVGQSHSLQKLDYDYETSREISLVARQDNNVVTTVADVKDYNFEADADIDKRYNRRDTELATLAFYDAYAQAGKIFRKKHSVPVSANNIVNEINKSGHAKEYMKLKKEIEGHRRMSKEVYNDFRDVCGGGLVMVNPEYSYSLLCVNDELKGYSTVLDSDVVMTIKSIEHVDLRSAHPSQVYKREFPIEAPQDCTPAELKTISSQIKNYMLAYNEGDVIINEFIATQGRVTFPLYRQLGKGNEGPVSGYGTFRIKGLALKHFDIGTGLKSVKPNSGGFTLPSLWGSKTSALKSGMLTESDFETGLAVSKEVEGENISYIGSKIEAADSVTIKVTFEDLITNVAVYYDYDEIEVLDFHYYHMGRSSEYMFENFDYFANKKTAYKELHEATKEGDIQKIKKIAASTKYSASNKASNNASNSASNSASNNASNPISKCHVDAIIDLIKSGDTKGAEKFAETMLAVAKAQFNGIYGTAYQSLNRDGSMIIFDGSEVTWSKKLDADDNGIVFDSETSIDVMQGAYIAQWSRVDISLYTALCIIKGGIPLYIATDSIYYLITDYSDPDLKDAILASPFNRQCTAGEEGTKKDLFKRRINKNELGIMENENKNGAKIYAIGYTQSLKILQYRGSYNKKEQRYIRKLETTFSGCSDAAYFEGCKTVKQHFARLFQPNAYVSPFECNKNKKGKNPTDTGYVLVPQSFINNRADKIDNDGSVFGFIDNAAASRFIDTELYIKEAQISDTVFCDDFAAEEFAERINYTNRTRVEDKRKAPEWVNTKEQEFHKIFG